MTRDRSWFRYRQSRRAIPVAEPLCDTLTIRPGRADPSTSLCCPYNPRRPNPDMTRLASPICPLPSAPAMPDHAGDMRILSRTRLASPAKTYHYDTHPYEHR
jgi:hypothetical protein